MYKCYLEINRRLKMLQGNVKGQKGLLRGKCHPLETKSTVLELKND